MPQVEPQVLARAVSDGRVTVVHLAPRYATAIRMHEAVNSVVVGDPASFSAEHSEQEPNLVFVKPITTKPAQTNLLISTSARAPSQLAVDQPRGIARRTAARGRLRVALQASWPVSDRARWIIRQPWSRRRPVLPKAKARQSVR